MGPESLTLQRSTNRLQGRIQADGILETKAMPKKTIKGNDFLIPKDIAALFGYAPTLKTEDDEIYWNCMERFVKCVEPQDVIEWLWVKDVVDLSWEILRFRRLKIDLVESTGKIRMQPSSGRGNTLMNPTSISCLASSLRVIQRT
jgi:hypothetical protein